MRTLCHETADAALAIDPPRREAWLIDLADEPEFVSPICARHADLMSVPAGWLLHDERDGASALFAKRCIAERPDAERRAALTATTSPAEDEEATVTRLDHRRARLQRILEEPTLFEPGHPGTRGHDSEAADIPAASGTTDDTMPPGANDHSPDADVSSDDTAAKHNAGAEWIGEPDDRHNDLLDVDGSTPLLARAFRSSQAS